MPSTRKTTTTPRRLRAELHQSLPQTEQSISRTVALGASGQPAATRPVEVPNNAPELVKRPTFLTVGRVILGLSEAREAAESDLQTLGMELCLVNDVDVCVYLHRDEIRKKNRKHTQNPNRKPGQLRPITMERVDADYRLLVAENNFPPTLKLAYNGLERVECKDDPQVASIYLQFDAARGDFGAMVQERTIFREFGSFNSFRPVSRLCLLGEMVDYEGENTSAERWQSAQTVLEDYLGESFTTSPIEFTSGIPGSPLYGPDPSRPDGGWISSASGRRSNEHFPANTIDIA